MQGLMYPSSLAVLPRNQGSTGPSPAIWDRFTQRAMSGDGSRGIIHGDDFNSFGGTVTTNVGTYSGGYKSFEDTSCTLLQRADKIGVLRASLAATDNLEVNFQSGYSAGNLGVIPTSNQVANFFEARVAVGQIGNNVNLFTGVAEEGLAVTDGFFTDADALPSKDFIGFWTLAAAGATLKYGYMKAGSTAQTVGTAATLVADTFVNIGWVFDIQAPPNKRLQFFVDGVPLATAVSATSCAAATFPLDQFFSFYANLKNGSAATKYAEWNWWYYGQVTA